MFGDESLDKRFTPERQQVEFAENQLMSQMDSLYMHDPRLSPIERTPNPQKDFAKHLRQYIGYINSDNQRIIVINLLSFKNRKRALKHYRDTRPKLSSDSARFTKRTPGCFCAT